MFKRIQTPSRFFTVEEDKEVNNDVTKQIFSLSPNMIGNEVYHTKNVGHNVFRHAIFTLQWVNDLHIFFGKHRGEWAGDGAQQNGVQQNGAGAQHNDFEPREEENDDPVPVTVPEALQVEN